MAPRSTTRLAALLALAPLAIGAQAPALSLEQALQRADQHAFANRGARASADVSDATATTTLRGVLPAVRFEAGTMRTTDPIGAFGTTLRQRAITAQDFDPNRLNYPAAITNYSGGVVFEQPLFNADAWAGRRAAHRATDAVRAAADWTSRTTQVDVIRAYFGAVLSTEKAATLSVALRAAQEHARLAEAMEKNGLVTSSDAMLARVRAGDVEVMLVSATADATLARLGLATILGQPGDTAFTLPLTLPPASALRTLDLPEANTELQARADVQAARTGLDAAEADRQRATALYLPRLNGYARYDWNSALRPFGGDRNWTIGVMATWTPFAGASEIAEQQLTAARQRAASVAHDGSRANAALDVARTASAYRVALARLDIMDRTVHQGIDAHRIVARRYEGGLAPVVELLDAQAAETQAKLSHAAARYDVIVAAADRLRARGEDPGILRVLDRISLALTDR